VSPVRAITFDFNGTLSNDEPILCGIFRELFAERGRALSEQEYYDELAGLSDEAIVTTWLGEDYPDVAGAVSERVGRYRALVSDGSSIEGPTREAVRYAAARVPVAIVSGAAHSEIEPVIEAAGIASLFRTIVSSDSVVNGKPHPESYELVLSQLGIERAEALAFEDTESGVASATGAGMSCIAVRGTLRPERLARADELIDRIDVQVIRRVLAAP
jgi:beta-phosphoglucomutase